MNVLFAPDWRSGVPYQRLLAEALLAQGVNVDFLSNYKRVLPLWRLLRQQPTDLLHLHWPEAYYPQKRDRWDAFRRARFIPDLVLATRTTPFVFTAHNLAEHNLQHAFARANYAATYRRARVVFAHSAAAREELVRTYQIDPAKIRLIPHGDLSAVLPPPLPQSEARARLGLPPGRVCLMFGAVEPYKGLEEVIEYWKRAQPDALLVIAGRPRTVDYGAVIQQAAQGDSRIVLRFQWLADPELSLFLSAADVAVFNYHTIFTSGAATLARSFGLPLMIPSRLNTVDLAEPDPRVIRFEDFATDFGAKLLAALAVPPSFAAAAEWRAQTAWSRVAESTVSGYRAALRSSAADAHSEKAARQ